MLLKRRRALQVLGTIFGIGASIPLITEPSRATIMDSVTIEQTNRNSALRDEDEYCTISEELLERMSAEIGDQIRIGPDEEKFKYPSGLYTIIGAGEGSQTIGMSKSGIDRLKLKNNTSGFIREYAPHPDYESRETASANDEYVEILEDDGTQSVLVVCAPHGGWIEYPTDKQSQSVADTLDVTEWSCAGYNSGGGAYDRWHITSTDIDRRTFPKLDRIADRGFTHAVSFHGFSKDGIAIGGGADESLKTDIRNEIDEATGGEYDVYVATDGDYDGDSPENFVNWLTEDNNGVQIEQGWDARTDDWDTIAQAVSRVYAERI